MASYVRRVQHRRLQGCLTTPNQEVLKVMTRPWCADAAIHLQTFHCSTGLGQA